MSQPEPEVTVVIPVWGMASDLEGAAHSALAQGVPVSLIVVDNMSETHFLSSQVSGCGSRAATQWEVRVMPVSRRFGPRLFSF